MCVREGGGVVCVGDNRNPSCSAAAPRNHKHTYQVGLFIPTRVV